MEQNKFIGMNGLELLTALRNSCEEIVEQEYHEPIGEAEINEIKDELAVRSVEEARIKEDKDKANEIFNEQLKPVKQRKNVLIQELRLQTRLKVGKLFKFVEGHQAGFYDEKGVLIYTRPIREEERQISLNRASGE